MKRSFAKTTPVLKVIESEFIKKFHKLNEAMYLWDTECYAGNLYPTGALMQEKLYADERENDRN